jgi:hypothetical protein
MQAAWYPALVTDGETEEQVQSGAFESQRLQIMTLQ